MSRWLGVVMALMSGVAAENAGAQALSLGADSQFVVVPMRDSDEIRRAIDMAVAARREAQTDADRAERMRGAARARVALKRLQIDTVRSREKAAKDAKRTADGVALEAERKVIERERDLLDRHESLRNAELELARKRSELADATRGALEVELQLADRRVERERAIRDGAAVDPRLGQVINELERRTLEAQQKSFEKAADVADRQRAIVQRQLEILDAQRKLAAGG